MFGIQTLNKLSPAGLNKFGEGYTCGDQVQNPDAVLVRSASMHEMEFPSSLKAIARAGAGVNNIPVDKCSEMGIVVFNTPGANANAVKELVIAALLLSSRKIVQGIEWTKTLKGEGANISKLVEKGKSSFVGPEIRGKKLGVIGLGAIGILVANAASALGMEVYGYDPYLSVNAAWDLSHKTRHALTLDEIYSNCDYITVHVPLTPDTKEMINKDTLATMKDGVRILNFARGDLVNTADVLDALKSGKMAAYVTDFASEALLGAENVIVTPHLGASTPESEDNCASMAASELIDFLENGNIKNSVNMPTVEMPRVGASRICVIHKNIPNMLTQISAIVSKAGINIENMQSVSKKDYAYTILDTSDVVEDEGCLRAIDGVVSVRIIH